MVDNARLTYGQIAEFERNLADKALEESERERDDLRAEVEALTVTVQQRDAAIAAAHRMFERLPFDFGSNNWYESCEQVPREVERLREAGNDLLDALLTAAPSTMYPRIVQDAMRSWQDVAQGGRA